MRSKTSGTGSQNWLEAGTALRKPNLPTEYSRGCFFNRMQNILRTTAKSPLSMELHRPARFAAASPPWAYCGAKGTGGKNRLFACSALTNGLFEEFIVRRVEKSENRRWHTTQRPRS